MSSRFSNLGYQMGLISFVRPSTVMRNASRVPSIAGHRLSRAAGVFGGGIIGSPLRAWESLRHGQRIRDASLDESPVFIIGHWRSGTTHLHNILSQDPQFGCLRMFQALAPDCSITTKAWLPGLLNRVFPNKRPMDNLQWPMDAPQEEEIPLAKLTPYSWYMQFFFPKQAKELFRQGVLFESVGPGVRQEVTEKYMRLLKVASLHEGGRRLLLKNPVNTARIPMLLEMFPDAKFIAIHRHPFEVFPSTVNLHRKLLELTSFQSYDDELIEENVLSMYEMVMGKYLTDRDLIPAGNLVEVSYADLDTDPEAVIESIYRDLGLSGRQAARGPIESYLASQSEYRKNGFAISARAAEIVQQRWSFAFDEFGRERSLEENYQPS